ncbi:efflux RND transporter permease subunit [Vibrio lentus]|nr:efflux RND transporter permease subunit [Vibrio lentus]
MTFNFNKPQVEIEIDRDKAAQMNVSAQDIGTVLSQAISEGFVNYFSMDQRSYQVITKFRTRTVTLGDDRRTTTYDRIPVRWYRWLR